MSLPQGQLADCNVLRKSTVAYFDEQRRNENDEPNIKDILFVSAIRQDFIAG